MSRQPESGRPHDLNEPRIAVYPGSFDPITKGHADIVERLSPLFDQLIVLVSISSEKSALFKMEERMELAREALKGIPNVKVECNEGLTVNCLKNFGARYIVRGLRSEADLNHEWVVSNMNKDLYPQVETLLAFGRPELSHISSRAVKEVALHGGDVGRWVHPFVKDRLIKKIKELNE